MAGILEMICVMRYAWIHKLQLSGPKYSISIPYTVIYTVKNFLKS